MSKTFEELATQEIDGLYQGALFLTAGDEGEAEQLLIDTLGRSFHQFAASDTVEDIRRWLEGRLVSTFLEHRVGIEEPAPRRNRPSGQPGAKAAFGALDGKALHLAAATVPWGARVALWLVLLQRWSYADASAAMGVSSDVLRNLLEYRHTLMGAILGSNTGNAGARRLSGA
jgi:DNA-directed RNA polymerase specialized sigma24 family protein